MLKKGFTLIEIIVSLAVFSIMFTGIMTVFVSITRQIEYSRSATICTNYAVSVLNLIKDKNKYLVKGLYSDSVKDSNNAASGYLYFNNGSELENAIGGLTKFTNSVSENINVCRASSSSKRYGSYISLKMVSSTCTYIDIYRLRIVTWDLSSKVNASVPIEYDFLVEK
jgi:prepilin-type N-terminal cleavage/methylation domain-containing protein